MHSDLSKLPEQDFANASLAKELVEIQTELKMAEDALLKKCGRHRRAAGAIGVRAGGRVDDEHGEVAAPTPPKRDKWSQEESLSDKDKEAPMAELPGELQDIVGQLMEQEEDLFDEMEDVSSSAIDSLDKGAGWDAADGPILEQQRPGRDREPPAHDGGDGRPQRRGAPGQVQRRVRRRGGRRQGRPQNAQPADRRPDHARDKSRTTARTRSAAPPAAARRAARAARGCKAPSPGRPASATSNAWPASRPTSATRPNRLDLQFQVNHFHHTDLKKMIDTMSQVERDLKAGRPQNALRQRRVLAEGLGNVKQYLNGEFQVRQDSTSNLPTDVQKQILGSMQDPSPAGVGRTESRVLPAALRRLAASRRGAGKEAVATAPLPTHRLKTIALFVYEKEVHHGDTEITEGQTSQAKQPQIKHR